MLIEKRLGRDETIVINYNGLVAFESSVLFENFHETGSKLRSNRNNFFKVTGPGLIIFSMTNTSNYDTTNFISKLISFLWIFISILIVLSIKIV